jgi:hypothetical protein
MSDLRRRLFSDVSFSGYAQHVGEERESSKKRAVVEQYGMEGF